nr:hypothetical protein [Rhizobium sp. WYJ-E13]
MIIQTVRSAIPPTMKLVITKVAAAKAKNEVSAPWPARRIAVVASPVSPNVKEQSDIEKG